MLADIPGFLLYSGYDPTGITQRHDIFSEYFDSVPRNQYAVIRLHTRYSESNVRVVKGKKIRIVLMWRDLRDVVVSRYFWVKTLRDNPFYQLYHDCSIEEGIMYSAKYVFKRYVPWVRKWKDYAEKHPDNFMFVTYEGLKENPYQVIRSVLDFYEIEISPEKIKNVVRNYDRIQIKKKIPTFRKGDIGDWRNFFSEDHIEEFKRNAGDILVELGYERHLDW